MFEVGDKVVCVDVGAGDIGWEKSFSDFTRKRPVEGRVYTVDRVSYRADISWIGLAEQNSYAYHTDHFRHYKITNQDRVEERRKQLCLSTETK